MLHLFRVLYVAIWAAGLFCLTWATKAAPDAACAIRLTS